MKNALAQDEEARKETAASKERSGGVPDVGLAAMLRKESILQNAKTELSTDFANRLMKSDSEKNSTNKGKDIQLRASDDDEGMYADQRIRDKGGVTEMEESDSDTDDHRGMIISKSIIFPDSYYNKL